MKTNAGHSLIGWVLAIVCMVSLLSRVQEPADAISIEQTAARLDCAKLGRGEMLARTELYFGRGKPDGSTVSDDEFRAFLDHVITPRFPDGLTVLPGAGQFRGARGTVEREAAMFVILLYPAAEKDSSARIEEIRERYRKTFTQESVLRVDSDSCVQF